jgi:hypothetical protein
LCSTPSAVLGNFDGKYKQGVFHVHDVISGEGGICIASTERISID